MLAGQLGYGVAITSYNRNMFISMTAETRMMPDVERMRDFVTDAFAELKEQLPPEFQEAHTAKPRTAA